MPDFEVQTYPVFWTKSKTIFFTCILSQALITQKLIMSNPRMIISVCFILFLLIFLLTDSV